MKTINELKAERSALLKRNNEIYALVEKEQRAITEAEIAECKQIAADAGVTLRVRRYIGKDA